MESERKKKGEEERALMSMYLSAVMDVSAALTLNHERSTFMKDSINNAANVAAEALQQQRCQDPSHRWTFR